MPACQRQAMRGGHSCSWFADSEAFWELPPRSYSDLLQAPYSHFHFPHSTRTAPRAPCRKLSIPGTHPRFLDAELTRMAPS